MSTNPIALCGIEFVELAGPDASALDQMLKDFGFSKTMRHATRAIELYEQGEIRFLLNREPGTRAATFAKTHGPCIPSMAWRTELTPAAAVAAAVRRGAEIAESDYRVGKVDVLPAIYGIGDSLLYLTQQRGSALYESMGFVRLAKPELVPDKGFVAIDHLTNNVERGTMQGWADFYKNVFGFSEVRYFDIRGAKTGLTSYALRSPCGTFCIPINEGTDDKSQINEYLEEYKGPGIQHLAFLTHDILASLRGLEGATTLSFLDIESDYYDAIFDRVPNVRENHDEIRARNVLVDGDADGYLLQIFTHNVVGPIFIELIQRHNHLSFGEGNFGALFRSIEREQEKRGYLT
ncbi:MAG: 4-hydroxyphenylpyruvate dioxygenase [Sandaracinaceae bacterium]|jgi:4-hydroxyphenylpyruvate dioxygenase|nr:4-hydroxyphenylpyruvate dioxygenase [Sandaracinaceae bacterium]